MQPVKTWFHQKFTIISFLIPLLIVLSFIYCLLPGFSSAATSQRHMKVSIVNQDDAKISKIITSNLKKKLPVKKVITSNTLKEAKNKLEKHDISLIVVIPESFSKNVQKSRPIHVKYYVSSAANTVEQSASTTAINKINNRIKSTLQKKVIIGMLAKQIAPQIQQQMQQKMMAELQAKHQKPQNLAELQQQMQQQAKKQAFSQARKNAKNLIVQYDSETLHLGNSHSDKQYQMAGMFISMGQYLGIAIASAVLAWRFSVSRFSFKNKYAAFGTVQLTGLLITLVLSLVAVAALRSLIKLSFGSLFLYNWLVDLAFFEFTVSIALLLKGLPSMAVQIPVFMIQIISGGGILPNFAIPDFYQQFGRYTPMHSAMQGNMHLIHDLGAMSPYVSSLWWILLISLVISICIVWIEYRQKQPKALEN